MPTPYTQRPHKFNTCFTAEGSVWQLRGGWHLSSPGSPEIWSEALQSATVTKIKKLILMKSYILLRSTNLPIILTLSEEYANTHSTFMWFSNSCLKSCKKLSCKHGMTNIRQPLAAPHTATCCAVYATSLPSGTVVASTLFCVLPVIKLIIYYCFNKSFQETASNREKT